MPKDLIPESILEDCARRFKLLSETVRLQLINQLHSRGELTVRELVDATGHQQANVSKHLLIMAREGFLDRRREGLNVYYSISNPASSGICLLITACLEWSDRARAGGLRQQIAAGELAGVGGSRRREFAEVERTWLASTARRSAVRLLP